jgi:hypothetical protein
MGVDESYSCMLDLILLCELAMPCFRHNPEGFHGHLSIAFCGVSWLSRRTEPLVLLYCLLDFDQVNVMVAYLGPMGSAWAFAKILRQIDPRQATLSADAIDCETDGNPGLTNRGVPLPWKFRLLHRIVAVAS